MAEGTTCLVDSSHMPSRLPLIAGYLLLCILPHTLPAQEPPPRRSSRRPAVGAEVGYSRSDLGGPTPSASSSRQGALTGVYLQTPIAGRCQLPAGDSVRAQGRAGAGAGGRRGRRDGGARHRAGLPRAAAPARVGASRAAASGRSSSAGPAPALQIGCDLQVVDPSTALSAPPATQTDVPPFRQFDVGIVVGGGLEVRWPQSALALEARYTAGLRSVLRRST